MSEELLKISLPQTLESFRKSYRNISWSKHNDFSSCPAKWFTRNFAVVKGAELGEYDSTKAIAGVIIQKIFEVFINERVYSRNEMSTLESLHKWCEDNSRHLFKCCVFDLSEQHKSKFNRPRYFFRRTSGKERTSKFRDAGMDVKIIPFQPAFVDFNSLYNQYGSEEKFFKFLSGLYPNIIKMFLENKINLDFMISEEYVKINLFEDVQISGQIDFIYNKYGRGIFSKLKELKSNFIVLDGKFRVSSYVKKDQLFFYSTLLYIRTRKRPEHVAFIDWNKAKLVTHKFDLDYIQRLKEDIYNQVRYGDKLKEEMEGLVHKFGEGRLMDISEIKSLDFNANQTSCFFCTVRKLCPACREAKIYDPKIQEGIDNKSETESYIKQEGVNNNGAINELKL